MNPVDELEQLAQCLAVTVAPTLALAVHVEDADQVGALLEPLTRQELLALAVVLAAQVGQPRTRPEDGVIDEVAIARAIRGQDVALTRSERAAAVLRMQEAGVTPTEIAKRLHLSGRRVRQLLEADGGVRSVVVGLLQQRGDVLAGVPVPGRSGDGRWAGPFGAEVRGSRFADLGVESIADRRHLRLGFDQLVRQLADLVELPVLHLTHGGHVRTAPSHVHDANIASEHTMRTEFTMIEDMTHSPAAQVDPCATHISYRLNCEQYEALLNETGGGCQICGFPADRMPQRKLYIDHHADGSRWRVRGLLCISCNSRLGQDVAFSAAASSYLANAWFLRQCVAAGLPDGERPEPASGVVYDNFGRRWRRSRGGLWRTSSKQQRPALWPALVRRAGPFNLHEPR